MGTSDLRDALVQKRSELLRLIAQAERGAFSVGDEPNTRTQENMDEHVARLRHALQDVEMAIAEIDEHNADRS